jgi:hypothetical protein
MSKCEHRDFIRVEELWDYDWVLYIRCEDCWLMINSFTKREFDEIQKRESYWLTYQYKNWKLNWYSIYKAEWLNSEDDIHSIENRLWWTRWINWDLPLHFKPVKTLELEHIKNILETQNIRDELKEYFLKRLNE